MAALVVVLAGAGAWYFYFAKPAPEEPVACTQEAKLCPDGVTYVGRQGPHCEFAACPAAATSSLQAPQILKTGLNQRVAGDKIAITPVELLQDSRCPAGVYCIQAGTVSIQANVEFLGSQSVETFTLNQPVEAGGFIITLSSVDPLKTPSTPLSDGDYRFTFEVKTR